MMTSSNTKMGYRLSFGPLTILLFGILLISPDVSIVNVSAKQHPFVSHGALARRGGGGQNVDVKAPPPSSSSSRGIDDVKTAATKAVVKGTALQFFEGIQHTIQDFLSGNYTWKEAIFLILAIASVGLSCSAMIATSSSLVDVLAWTCLVVGPSAAILQRKVGLLEGMRELTNQLRAEVNEISANNAILQSQNRRLSKNTQKLKKTQSALEEISASQGISIDKLVNQVNEYKQIQDDIKTDLRSKIQQTLLNVFMKSDKDENFVIDPDEINRLVMRLKGIPSVEFDEDKFRRALNKEGGDIMKFADKYLNSQSDPSKDGIFKF